MRLSLLLLFVLLCSCSGWNKFAKQENKPFTESDYLDGFNNEVSKYGLKNGETILDLGSLTGKFSSIIFRYYPQSKIVLEDVYNMKPHLYNYSFVQNDTIYKYKTNRTFKKGRPDKIPSRPNTFNTIICRKTYHEFNNNNKLKMLSEMHRVLKDNGVLLVVDVIPNYEGQRDAGCKNLYLKWDNVQKEVVKNGFELLSVDSTSYNLLDSTYHNYFILKFKKLKSEERNWGITTL